VGKRGPKTLAGKKAVSQNARRHGLTGKALILSSEERQEFEGLRAQLFDELDPIGSLEQIAVEDIAVSYWRYRQALQWERSLFKRASSREGVLEGPSVPKRRDLKLLLELLGSANNPQSESELESALRENFGNEFVDGLLAWTTESPLALAFARHCAEKTELYGDEPPPGVSEELRASQKPARRKADDALTASFKEQARRKLFKVAGEFLFRLEEVIERQRVLEQSGNGIDSATRYISSIRKALYQAMLLYRNLRESRG